MRILFATTRGAGHFNPLLPFIDAALREGHDILVAGPVVLADAVERAGYSFWPREVPPEHLLGPTWGRAQTAGTAEGCPRWRRRCDRPATVDSLLPSSIPRRHVEMEQRTGSSAVETVDDYLATLPEKERTVLQELRETIRSAAPEAEEVISYRIPLYKHHGHLVGFAAFKNHCSLFVTNSAVRDQFAKELEPYKVEGTTIRFTVENPLPAALVKRIVKSRIAENEARAASR